MAYLRNWRCYSYGVQGDSVRYDYRELKDFFQLDGSDTSVCLQDFSGFHKGENCRVVEGPSIGKFGLGFMILKALSGRAERSIRL